MRSVSYVNGMLVVVRDDNRFDGEVTCPSFITETPFYYEPTIQRAGSRDLTAKEITQAEKFITTFSFPVDKAYIPETLYVVDKWGNYLGTTNDPTEDMIVIPDPEFIPVLGMIYDFDLKTFKKVCLVDANGVIIGIDTNLNHENSFYVPPYNEKFSTESQVWDFDKKEWKIDFNLAKASMIKTLTSKYQRREGSLSYKIALPIAKVDYWDMQIKEAEAWSANNATPTPYIDALYASRNSETTVETKEELIGKILTKSKAYVVVYGKMFGKYQVQLEAITDEADYPKYEEIRATMKAEHNSVFGEDIVTTYGTSTVSSYVYIAKDYNAWIAYPSTTTTFIDAVLEGRGDNMNKADYFNKMMALINDIKVKKGDLLGKYQSVLKVIENTTTVDELLALDITEMCNRG